MDMTVGSGRVITMPVITEDGQPIETPNSDGGASVESEQQTSGAPLPKEVIQWKLTLHQIGKHCCPCFACFVSILLLTARGSASSWRQ